jgi:hypothetical protein
MDRPGETVLVVRKVVGAGPAIQRRSVMRRKLLTLFSVVSLLLCVAACVLWARSFVWYERVMWASPDKYRRVQSLNGRLVFELTTGYPLKNASSLTSERVNDDQKDIDWAVGLADGWQSNKDVVDWKLGSFAYAASSARYFPAQRIATRVRMLVIPYWAVVAATAILPSTALLRMMRRMTRRRRGLCRNCGYDLRASSERCPECGAIVTKGNTKGRNTKGTFLIPPDQECPL